MHFNVGILKCTQNLFFIKCSRHHRPWGDCWEGSRFHSQFSRGNMICRAPWEATGVCWKAETGRKKHEQKACVVRQAENLTGSGLSCCDNFRAPWVQTASGCQVSAADVSMWISLSHEMLKPDRQGGLWTSVLQAKGMLVGQTFTVRS